MTDREWETFGRENAARGRGAARISAKATAYRQKQQDAADEAVKDAQDRLDKEDEKRRMKAEQAEKERQERNARYAGVATRAVLGRGDNKYAQGGGAAGAMAGEAIGAAVGGPVGAVVGQVLGKVVGEKIGARLDDPLMELTKTAKFAGEAVQFLGAAAVKTASGDAIGLFRQGVEGAAKGLEQLPIAGKAAAEALRTAGTAATAIKDAADAFAARGQELKGFSGSIAVSSAMQSVNRTLSDIREAQLLGDRYAALIDAQTRFDETIKAGLLPLKEIALDVLPKLLDGMLDGFESVIRIGYLIPGVSDDRVTRALDDMTRIRTTLEQRNLPADAVKRMLTLPDFPAFRRPGEAIPPPGPLAIPIIP